MVNYRPPQGATRRAGKLRNNPTEAGKRMWRLLRECLPDARFRRQVPISDFIADFASHGLELVVEVDGGEHDARLDERRMAPIEAEGYRVVRFWNHDVLGNGDGVAEMLASYCGNTTPTQPSPIKGEGL